MNIEEKLNQRQNNNSLRKLTVQPGLIDFFSNDYLGIAREAQLEENIHRQLMSLKDRMPINGSTGSRLLSGNSLYAEETEAFLSTLFRSKKTLVFNSGFNANLAILSSIPQKGDTILYDELIHASMKDGARLSFSNRLAFKHNDLSNLEQKLQKSEGEKFVVAESVYSMDGDFCPLERLLLLCEKYNAHLILDEAHSTGIWGAHGAGIACSLGLQERIFARIYTFGKAMGIHGACIAGSESLIEYLINFARPFIYTTALPPHGFAAINEAFRFVREHPERSESLKHKIEIFKNNMRQQLSRSDTYILIESDSAIQALRIPGNTAARQASDALRKKGIDARAILSPTVKEGEERLRICLHSFNTDQEIEYLVNSLEAIANLPLHSKHTGL